MTKVLVVGDIGQAAYHVGDEAMTIATAEYLAEHGAQVVLATRDKRHSTKYISSGAPAGAKYRYIPFLRFPWGSAEREHTLELFEEYLRTGAMPKLPDFAPAAKLMRAFVKHVSAVDAVVISGGGNLNSQYGWLLYERAAIALVAQYRGIPLYVSSQSLGPVLTDPDAEVLARMLRSAAAVSVRESDSLAWCTSRGIEAVAGVDDATGYTPHSPEIVLQYSVPVEVPALPEDYVCVTIDDADDDQVRHLAELLDYAYTEHGLRTVFLGHQGNPDHMAAGRDRGDYEVHARIAAQMSTPSTLMPITHTDAAVRIHRRAAVTLTSRYHPAIFSLSAGVPVVALVPNAFTEMRLGGAMRQYGMSEFATPLGMLGTVIPARMLSAAVRLNDPSLGPTFTQLQQPRRDAIRGVLGEWRQYMWQCIAGNTPAQVPRGLGGIQQVDALSDPLHSVNRAARQLFVQTSLSEGNEWALSDRMHSLEYRRRLELEEKDQQISEITEGKGAKPTVSTQTGIILRRLLGR